MKREQVVELIKNHADGLWNKNDNPNQPMADEVDITELADAILAFPLDSPSDEEIIIRFNNYSNCYAKCSIVEPAMTRSKVLGLAKWMRDEIIKRNK